MRNNKKTERLKALTYKRYGQICARCGCTSDIQMDHIKPYSLFFWLRYSLSNMQPLCGHCNKWKGTKIVDLRPYRWRLYYFIGRVFTKSIMALVLTAVLFFGYIQLFTSQTPSDLLTEVSQFSIILPSPEQVLKCLYNVTECLKNGATQ